MPFDDVANYLQDSFARRYDEIRNGQKQKWFTNDVDNYNELFDKFDRTEYHSKWEAMKKKPTQDYEYSAIKVKIAWLGGTLRDLRTLYVCGRNNRPRVPQDSSRFNMCVLGYINFLLEKLKKSLTPD
ncbi:hypothetical protein ACFLQL_00250 [Verrucomicrobiota bacterium]